MTVKTFGAAFRQGAKKILKITLTPLFRFVRRHPGLKRRAVRLLQRFPLIDVRVYTLLQEQDVTRLAPPDLVQILGELPPRGQQFLHILTNAQTQESQVRD